MENENMKLHYFKNFFSLGVIMIFTGCVAGLKRTNIQKWERKEFSKLGVSLESPSNIERFMLSDSAEYKREWKCKIMTFSMHPVYHGGLTEPLYLINFRLCVLDKNEYKSYLTLGHVENANRKFQNTRFCKKLTEFEVTHPNGRTPLACFRKDYKNEKTGEVILAAITYLDNYEGNMQYKDKDIKTIKRILDSIKFLDSSE